MDPVHFDRIPYGSLHWKKPGLKLNLILKKARIPNTACGVALSAVIILPRLQNWFRPNLLQKQVKCF
jgi:hypothetical protein